MNKELEKDVETMITACEETGQAKGYIEVLERCKQALEDKDKLIQELDKENSALKGTTISEKVRNSMATYTNENGVLMVRCTFKEYYTMAVQIDKIREMMNQYDINDENLASDYMQLIIQIIKESE